MPSRQPTDRVRIRPGARPPDRRPPRHPTARRPARRYTELPRLRLLSLGAGVQSSAVLLLACEGVIPRFDVALFADTQFEPKAVYEQLDRLRAIAARVGIPVRVVSAGSLRRDVLDPQRRFVTMPLHVRNPDGSKGMARRQCLDQLPVLDHGAPRCDQGV
jgi:hypothetical protein